MDFSGVTNDTSRNVTAAVDGILSMGISPADKESQIARVFIVVGREFHDQLYDASSQVFDSRSINTTENIDRSQAERLANKVVRNYALTRNTAAALINEFYNSILGQAQHEAFQNALSLQKHPTLTRSLGPKKDCKFCIKKEGTHPNPSRSDFRRHDRCDCVFTVSGYNSRNGVLNNYKKGK